MLVKQSDNPLEEDENGIQIVNEITGKLVQQRRRPRQKPGLQRGVCGGDLKVFVNAP